MRRRTLWIPALLSALALLLVVGGIAVGHYYWSTLRGSMGRMADSMSVARQRQQDLLDQISESQALFAAQQALLQEEADALRRREETLAAARRPFAMERLSMARTQTECARQPAGPTPVELRFTEAARLVEGWIKERSDGSTNGDVLGGSAALDPPYERPDAPAF